MDGESPSFGVEYGMTIGKVAGDPFHNWKQSTLPIPLLVSSGMSTYNSSHLVL